MSLLTLKTSGYAVVSSFLSKEEINQMVSLYKKSKNSSISINYQSVFGIEPHRIETKLNELLSQIKASTDIKADKCGKGTLFLDTTVSNFPWHQEHESYYLYQSAYNVLIVWIPLIKPNSKVSGLSVIPFDKLETTNSVALFRHKGAQRILMDDTSYNLHDDETGVVTALDFNPNDISINIECNPGDAVIMRGDLLHKTQDQKDKRLAVSIRCYQSDTILTKEKFDVTCEYKQRMINNSTLFKKISSKYEQNPTLSVSEVLE